MQEIYAQLQVGGGMEGLDDRVFGWKYPWQRQQRWLERFEALREDVKAYKLDWALLSPEPGDKEREVFGGFIDQLGLAPVRLEKAYLFRTSALYGKGP